MLIRWLLIALFIYLVIKLIRGPKNKKKRQSPFPFDAFQQNRSSRKGNGKPDFDQIEEAEFEDITEKEKKRTDNK
jgi:hypothetical protein